MSIRSWPAIENAFNEMQRLKEKRESEEILQRRIPQPSPNQVPAMTPPSAVVKQIVAPAGKAGWGWIFLIVGGGLFVFWGIPLLQNKGGFKPGISKPPGYVPTRLSPGTGE